MFPIITLTALLQFCGPAATKTVVTSSYEEDLSEYRDDYEIIDEETSEESMENEIEEVIREDTEPMHGIGEELDSVTNIMIASRISIEELDGFTIQIYSGNSRDKANSFRRAAFELIEDTKPVLIYEQPNYKVRIGKYYSRIEANEDFNILSETFSRAVLIPTKIKIDNGQ
ncbi:MAG: SPOR domain-containing protein [Reichenbachiella sp.]